MDIRRVLNNAVDRECRAQWWNRACVGIWHYIFAGGYPQRDGAQGNLVAQLAKGKLVGSFNTLLKLIDEIKARM